MPDLKFLVMDSVAQYQRYFKLIIKKNNEGLDRDEVPEYWTLDKSLKYTLNYPQDPIALTALSFGRPILTCRALYHSLCPKDRS